MYGWWDGDRAPRTIDQSVVVPASRSRTKIGFVRSTLPIISNIRIVVIALIDRQAGTTSVTLDDAHPLTAFEIPLPGYDPQCRGARSLAQSTRSL